MPRRPTIIWKPIRIFIVSGAVEKLLIDEPKVPKHGPTLLIIDVEALTEVKIGRAHV